MATPAVSLHLLDGFDLLVDGRSVPLPLAAQRLIAFLALHDRPLLRSYVGASLWLDKTDERAAANLRSTLWRVRQPGVTVIAASATHVGLDPRIEVDVRSFVRQARGLIAGISSAEMEKAARLDPAGLLASELLPDWYDEWVFTERERLRHLRLHALEQLSVELAADGRFAEAIDAALVATTAEPLRETAHRALIQAHLAEGNQSEAVRQYRAYCRLLHDQLGAGPSPSLSRLIEQHEERSRSAIRTALSTTRPCKEDRTGGKRHSTHA